VKKRRKKQKVRGKVLKRICHKKFHTLANPVVDLLLMVIQQLAQNLQPKKPHKIGFIWKNGKRVGKGGKKK